VALELQQGAGVGQSTRALSC